VFRGIEASQIRAHKFINRPDTYAYIGTDKGLRVLSRGTTDIDPVIYRNVYARDFIERSSRKSKENRRKCEIKALDAIDKLEVVSFNVQGADEDRIGVIAENSPEISSDGGEYISQYRLLTTITKSVQEIVGKIDKLEEHVYAE